MTNDEGMTTLSGPTSGVETYTRFWRRRRWGRRIENLHQLLQPLNDCSFMSFQTRISFFARASSIGMAGYLSCE